MSQQNASASALTAGTRQDYDTLTSLLFEKRIVEAIDMCRRLLNDHPDDDVLWHFQGVAYHAKGDHQQAMAAFDRALGCNPNNWKVLYHLGALMMEQGRIEQAIRFFESVLQHNANHMDALDRLTTLFMQTGNHSSMLAAALMCVQKCPSNPEYWLKLKRAMEQAQQGIIPEGFKEFLISQRTLMSRHNVGLTSVAAYTLFSSNPVFQQYMLQVRRQGSGSLDMMAKEPAFIHSLQDPLFHVLLEHSVVSSHGFEMFITAVRHALLSRYHDVAFHRHLGEEEVRLLAGLGKYFFRTEYLPEVTDDEKATLHTLSQRLDDMMSAPAADTLLPLLLWVMYAPLHQWPRMREWRAQTDFEALPGDVRAMIALTHDEFEQEERIGKELPALGRIADPISRKVQEQYEENPYPRWDMLPPSRPLKPSELLDHMLPFQPLRQVQIPDCPEILIAGCGTGRHSLSVAASLPDARLTNVDLSRSSLAYAVRKARELGMEKQHRFIQADILELEQLNQKFDIIEAVGVLHHMENPMAGWAVLNSILRPDGLMRIGLYSRIARQNIIQARAEIAARGYEDTPDDIRRFRRETIAAGIHPFIHSADFFTTSSVRDLLFHRQEHQFTISQIHEYLQILGLEFLGFTSNGAIYERYRQSFPSDTEYTNLERWAQLEEKDPSTFFGMYQFYCYKPS